MSIQTGVYAGDDSGVRSISTGFAPSVVFLHMSNPAVNHHNNFRGRCRLSNFVNPTHGAVLGVPTGGDPGAGDASFGYQGTTEGIVSLDATGFTVSTVFNATPSHYMWVAMTTNTNEITIGTYAGTGSAQNINIGFDAEIVFIFNRATATADQHATWQDRQLNSEDVISTWVGGASPASGLWELGAIGTSRFELPGAAFNRTGENYEWLAIARSGFIVNRIGIREYLGDGTDGRSLSGATFGGAAFTPEFVMGFKRTGLVVIALNNTLASTLFNQGGSIETVTLQEQATFPSSSPNSANAEEGIQAFNNGGVTVDAGATNDMNESGANDEHMLLYFLTGAATIGIQVHPPLLTSHLGTGSLFMTR